MTKFLQNLAYQFFLLILFLGMQIPGAFASRPYVPESLRPWIPWVLHGHEEKLCSFLAGQEGEKFCQWPGKLTLTLHAAGGTFEQDWEVEQKGWVLLPGAEKIWPQKVSVNDKAQPVLHHNASPAIWLGKGRQHISGSFVWKKLPEFLPVPATTALVALKLNEEEISRPYRDEEGRLWLSQRESGGEAEELLLSVSRKITDAVPLTLTTRLDLEVSGKAREITLPNPMPENFIPMQLDSPLPARLDQGKLNLQLRPGQWSLEFTTRSTTPVTELALPKAPAPWPAEEVWVFEARPELQVVDLSGVPSLDPRQTLLPESWKSLPAYRMTGGDKITFTQRSRGNEDPDPDRLNLSRTLWLDFDGRGYSFKDEIQATFRRALRLEMNPVLELGRVALDDEDQFITTLGSGKKGIEVPYGPSRIRAEGRGQWQGGKIPALGWDADYENVSGQLKLPPGWTALTLVGVDRASHTWFGRWTLLDLFLLAIFTIATRRLWGLRWGGIAFVTLLLTLTEAGAPYWLWLWLFATLALTRAIQTQRLGRLLKLAKNLVLLSLALVIVAFAAEHLRQGLHPGLRGSVFWGGGNDYGEEIFANEESRTNSLSGNAPAAAMQMLSKSESYDQNQAPLQQQMEAPRIPLPGLIPKIAQKYYAAKLDPTRQVQTGFGLPSWEWQSLDFSFGGPVTRDHEFRAILLSPRLNCILAFVRVLLLMLVLAQATGKMWPRPPAVAASLLFLVFWLGTSSPALAEASSFPPQKILKKLRARLLETPHCAPDCAEISALHVEIQNDTLRLVLSVEAGADTAIPLPAHEKDWLPQRVTRDENEPATLRRDENGFLWLKVPAGNHQIVAEGPSLGKNEIRLPLSLKPRRVEAQTPGWLLSGLDENGVPQENLTLTRLEKQQGPAAESPSQKLPSLVEVRRRLTLGLKWEVETEVTRLSGSGQPVVLEIPLLAGESVMTETANANKNSVLVNLGPQSDSFAWQSSLPLGEKIELQAPQNSNWVESWLLESSSLWHVESSGIPALHPGQNPGAHQNEWRPWPGEKVLLAVSKPAGAKGPTLTIDRADLDITPGLKTSQLSLKLKLRSSTGGKQLIGLGQDVQLKRLAINNIDLPARLDGTNVEIPLTPGPQTLLLEWTENRGLTSLYQTPQIKLGGDIVNTTLRLHLPHDRWVLCLKGPRLGAVVQFWSLVTLVLMVAVALSRFKISPLRHYQWFLMLLGLTQTSVLAGAFVVLWLLWLGRLEKTPGPQNEFLYDLRQLTIAFVTLAALGILLEGVRRGLLGLPEMHIAGLGSSTSFLRWYQDRSSELLPQAMVLSLPLLAYHLAMMAWGLWLAFSVLNWLKLGWKNATANGVWKAISLRVRKQ